MVKVAQRLLGGKREGKQTKTEVDAVEHVGAVQDLKDEQDDCAEDERAKYRDSPPVCVFTACVCRVEVCEERMERKKRKRAELIRMAGDAKVVLGEKVEDEEEDDHLEEEEDKGPDGAAEEELLREQERELDKEERREEELPREPDAFAEHCRDLREGEREDRKRRKRVQCRCCAVCVFFPCRAQ